MSDAIARDEPGALCEANIGEANIRAVRLGHGANCSSVGSVIDTLFVSAAVGGAIFAAICAAMQEEPVRVVGRADEAEPNANANEPDT